MKNVTKYLCKLILLYIKTLWFSGSPAGGTGQTQKHGTSQHEWDLPLVHYSNEGMGETGCEIQLSFCIWEFFKMK